MTISALTNDSEQPTSRRTTACFELWVCSTPLLRLWRPPPSGDKPHGKPGQAAGTRRHGRQWSGLCEHTDQRPSSARGPLLGITTLLGMTTRCRARCVGRPFQIRALGRCTTRTSGALAAGHPLSLRVLLPFGVSVATRHRARSLFARTRLHGAFARSATRLAP